MQTHFKVFNAQDNRQPKILYLHKISSKSKHEKYFTHTQQQKEHQQHTRTAVNAEGSPLGKREMQDGHLDLDKTMKGTGNVKYIGKYKVLLFFNLLKV